MSIKLEQCLRVAAGSAGHLVEGPILNGPVQNLDDCKGGAMVVYWTLGSRRPYLQHIGDTRGLAGEISNGDSEIALLLKSLVQSTSWSPNVVPK